MTMDYDDFPEDNVNVTPVNPLVELAYLLAAIAVFAVAIYGSLGLAATQLAIRINPQTEENIGQAVTAGLRPATFANDSRVAYLENLLAALEADVAKTTLGNSAYPPLKVAILNEESENAMVTVGSYLFVTDGLLQSVKTENELAFVLAHELGHLHYRDPLKALGRSLIWSTLNTLLGTGDGSGAIATAANLASLSYGRSQETAADNYALVITIAHYRHAGHSLGFFERAQAEEIDLGMLSKLGEWQQTHPLTGDRIQNLKNTIKAKNWPITGAATPLPKGIECPNFRCE